MFCSIKEAKLAVQVYIVLQELADKANGGHVLANKKTSKISIARLYCTSTTR